MDIRSADGSERPAFVNVETAAKFLGISRGMGYSLAHSYLDHGSGIRCVRLGTRLLVPVAWLLEVACTPTESYAEQTPGSGVA